MAATSRAFLTHATSYNPLELGLAGLTVIAQARTSASQSSATRLTDERFIISMVAGTLSSRKPNQRLPALQSVEEGLRAFGERITLRRGQ
jgi:hypothetical protein